jgi:hypothetical protein
LAGKCPNKPQLAGGVEGHNINNIALPGSPTLWVGSSKFGIEKFNPFLSIVSLSDESFFPSSERPSLSQSLLG